ncbi:MAG: hypothetical protein ABIK89_26450 [Planctomycetota bacterium]
MTTCKTLSMALLSFIALFSMAAGAEDNQPPEGFTSLFNGKDMTGWKADPQRHWKADAFLTADNRYALNAPANVEAARTLASTYIEVFVREALLRRVAKQAR